MSGDLEVYLECLAILTSVLEETNLRPFFHPKEWPLWNWPLSVGGTELRYLATISCSGDPTLDDYTFQKFQHTLTPEVRSR